jgi:precorrin-3B methylase
MFQRASTFEPYRENALVSLAQLAIEQENFERALTLLRAHRAGDTPAIVATDVAREDELLLTTTLAELDPDTVTMRSLVLIAGETAEWTPAHLIARRG